LEKFSKLNLLNWNNVLTGKDEEVIIPYKFNMKYLSPPNHISSLTFLLILTHPCTLAKILFLQAQLVDEELFLARTIP
jgi:hypothetical protein